MNRTPFDEMERMFDQMRRSMFDAGRPTYDRDSSTDVNLSLESTDEGYVVHADLPGFEREELDLRFDDGVLTISGSHEVSGEEFARSRRVHERVTVPGEVSADDISATYRNGVLEVVLPTEEAPEGGRSIDVQ